MMLKLAVCFLLTLVQCRAFAPAFGTASGVSSSTAQQRQQQQPTTFLSATSSTETKKREGGVADELGLPCEDECSLQSYPNLPDSVHPGVLSGQAMMDLLEDAKKKGTSL